MRIESFVHSLQGIGQKDIIGIQPVQLIASRPLEPAMDRIRLALVGLGLPVVDFVRIVLDDLDRSVGTAPIENKELMGQTTLADDRAQGLIQIRRLVVAWGHDRDLH